MHVLPRGHPIYYEPRGGYLYLPAAQRDPEQRDPEQRDPEQLVRVLVLVLPRGQVWQMF